MLQPPRFSYCFSAVRQRPMRETLTKIDKTQMRLGVYVWILSGLMSKRVVAIGVIKRGHFFQMRAGPDETAKIHQGQGSPRTEVAQNKPRRVVALTAQTQQIRVQALRQIKFAAHAVIQCLPMRNVKEF